MLNSSLLNAGVKICIIIATVLSMNPSILVLDKPSTGLDPRSQNIDQFTARIANHHTRYETCAGIISTLNRD
jgi:energy-coupling factor transporter ATP-binding protein EcfA2